MKRNRVGRGRSPSRSHITVLTVLYTAFPDKTEEMVKKISVDLIIHVLGSNETYAQNGTPFDFLCRKIAQSMNNAVYSPKLLTKTK
ncbi:MAG: hypothetical protein JSW07_07065, partial [bacterium]